MKRYLLILSIVLISATSAYAQSMLVIGEKAPDLKVKQWVGEKPGDGRRAQLIEFFYAAGNKSTDRLPKILSLAKQFNSSLTIILVSKESADVVESMLPANPPFFTCIDDGGATYSAYGVKFVPFSVLVDDRKRILWFGNSASLTPDILAGLLSQK